MEKMEIKKTIIIVIIFFMVLVTASAVSSCNKNKNGKTVQAYESLDIGIPEQARKDLIKIINP